MGAAWTPSKRQLKEIDRFRGALLLLPWPADLPEPPQPPAARRDREYPTRDASPDQREAALALVRDACRAHALRAGDVTVIWPRRHPPRNCAPGPRLAVFVIGSRWPAELDRIDDPAPHWLWVETLNSSMRPPRRAEETKDLHDSSPPASPADLLADVGRACYGDRWRANLARAIGVDDDTVRRWMTGRTELRMDHGIWRRVRLLITARRMELEDVEARLRRAA